ncbi:hypothetical protein [Halovivax gelatinilyticus]|uniref:hypothetical protein n=1 Tax=Halovivax gelatinilyticus TaxID=2961597 RepID=UPI0020CA4EFE|nr:hypothetical protein [Halovivax gelatinilyticus]
MATDSAHDPLSIDRENARLAAIGLGVWLAITLAAVVLLWVFGPSVSGLFI